ncbi:uncharacterized protein BP5553_03112 [Venustampulla echinocandica]|uniref:GIY-YIG domain-containing protein n=1 Tax=Venustampulla echinocandica TaxID=2656787 RepID=A0A370TTB6_9HELO|nr:uncharacterized protein BP5553_03112 [Venustampulla echinocandica]RDL38772.1 hypothetical protein BP5553_03112 [Venustampulla echinocandica]
MRPILPNMVELPDDDCVEVVGIIRNSSQSKATHVHLFPKSGENEPKCCIRIESSTRQVVSTKCADFGHSVDSNVAKLEGALVSNYTGVDISPIFENDMAEFGNDISHDCTVDDLAISYNKSIESTYSNGGRSSTSHPRIIRMTANITHKTVPNSHRPIIRHVLDVLAGDNSSILVADSENVYKNLIGRLTLHRIEMSLLAALDPDIEKVHQIGPLDFDTLKSLDHSKAESYKWPGIYLHVIYDEEHYGTFWLYVGAGMDVKSRIAQHYKFRYTPSRRCLHYHMWNMPGQKDFFVLLGDFKGMAFDYGDQSAMNNLFEEWSCLIWQTLPSSLLSVALPQGFRICEANIHLNRASPLRQKYNRKAVTEGNFETALELRLGAKDLLMSHDPDIRAYFERRGGYYDLPM